MSRTKVSQVMHEVASLPVTGADMSTTVNCAQDIIYIKSIILKMKVEIYMLLMVKTLYI
jgi:hypothetical protein